MVTCWTSAEEDVRSKTREVCRPSKNLYLSNSERQTESSKHENRFITTGGPPSHSKGQRLSIHSRAARGPKSSYNDFMPWALLINGKLRRRPVWSDPEFEICKVIQTFQLSSSCLNQLFAFSLCAASTVSKSTKSISRCSFVGNRKLTASAGQHKILIIMHRSSARHLPFANTPAVRLPPGRRVCGRKLVFCVTLLRTRGASLTVYTATARIVPWPRPQCCSINIKTKASLSSSFPQYYTITT